VRELALGDAEGTERLESWSKSELNTTKKLGPQGKVLHGINPQERPRMIEVQTSTLDVQAAAIERVRLLKIDVQGSELCVISGGLQTLQKTDCLVIEVPLAAGCYEKAASCSELLYEIQRNTPLRLSYMTPPAMNSQGIGVWANAIMVPEDIHR
jgi:hypothetical protein